MLLGDLISQLGDKTVALETLVSFEDLSLMLRVEEAASARNVSAGEFAAAAVGLFSSEASDEDWVSLIGAMGKTVHPGRICLKTMIEFAMRSDRAVHGCGCGHPEHVSQ